MMRAILIIGLPGSGKTTYAKTLGGLLVDDPMHEDYLSNILNGPEPLVVITDPMAVTASRKSIDERIGNRELTLVCFENDPDACWANLEHRGDGRISRKWLDRMSLSYDVERFEPELILPVYKSPLGHLD